MKELPPSRKKYYSSFVIKDESGARITTSIKANRGASLEVGKAYRDDICRPPFQSSKLTCLSLHHTAVAAANNVFTYRITNLTVRDYPREPPHYLTVMNHSKIVPMEAPRLVSLEAWDRAGLILGISDISCYSSCPKCKKGVDDR